MEINKAQTLVSVQDVSHQYSSQWAIKNINLTLDKNRIVGLLGSNGAGKSTLMNIICGVLVQTRGKVFINGHDINDDRGEAKKHLGFLPQKPPLHVDLTVEEYLKYTAHLRMIPRSRVKGAVDNVLEKCKITHFRNRLIKNLSGGYQQRVGIAQSIIHDPGFIVLDEPTNGLDPNQILEIRNLIKEIARDKIVLLSTHILQEVKAMCQDIIMIELGNFVFQGTIDEFNSSVVSNSIIAKMSNPPKLPALKQIEGVQDVENVGENTFRFVFERDDSLLDEIIRCSVENGWMLQEIYKEKVEPDQIFEHFSLGSSKSRRNHQSATSKAN